MKQKKILVVADVLWTTALNSVFLGVVFVRKRKEKAIFFPLQTTLYSLENCSFTRLKIIHLRDDLTRVIRKLFLLFLFENLKARILNKPLKRP